MTHEQNKTDEKWQCVICLDYFSGYGNNPDPVKEDGECCDKCNNQTVIPARLNDLNLTH